MLAHKAMRSSYYWPTMSTDSAELVKHCAARLFFLQQI